MKKIYILSLLLFLAYTTPATAQNCNFTIEYLDGTNQIESNCQNTEIYYSLDNGSTSVGPFQYEFHDAITGAFIYSATKTGTNHNFINEIPLGVYVVTVTDENGCSDHIYHDSAPLLDFYSGLEIGGGGEGFTNPSSCTSFDGAISFVQDHYTSTMDTIQVEVYNVLTGALIHTEIDYPTDPFGTGDYSTKYGFTINGLGAGVYAAVMYITNNDSPWAGCKATHNWELSPINEDCMLGLPDRFPLPIELSSFTARYLDDSHEADIRWTTASQLNVEYIKLLRSIDNRNFVPVYYKGNIEDSSETVYYQFKDDRLPDAEYVYYKLESKDFGISTLDFSGIITVKLPKRGGVPKVFPNPAKSFIEIELEFSQAQYTITDLLGNSLKNGFINQGMNSIQLETLQDGLYFLNVKREDNKIESYKFSKISDQ